MDATVIEYFLVDNIYFRYKLFLKELTRKP